MQSPESVRIDDDISEMVQRWIMDRMVLVEGSNAAGEQQRQAEIAGAERKIGILAP